jgi:hypothetical protein
MCATHAAKMRATHAAEMRAATHAAEVHAATTTTAMHATAATTAVKRERRRGERKRHTKRTCDKAINEPVGHLNSSEVEWRQRISPPQQDDQETQRIR